MTKEATKSRTRGTTRTKPKSVVVSARKTRSATKDLVERAVAVPSIEKPLELKRKTRKRKQSRSIERVADSTDDENESIATHAASNNEKKRKTKRRKKSDLDRYQRETSNDETERPLASSHRPTNSKRKTRLKEPDRSEDERETRADSTKRKKSKVRRKPDNETTKTKKGKTRRKKSPGMCSNSRSSNS